MIMDVFEIFFQSVIFRKIWSVLTNILNSFHPKKIVDKIIFSFKLVISRVNSNVP